MPDGAFYVYADCSDLLKDGGDADTLVKDVLNQVGVSMVSGLDFGPYTAQHYIRLSYATSMENLQEAVRRLGLFLGKNGV